jgi:hypothetical protein
MVFVEQVHLMLPAYVLPYVKRGKTDPEVVHTWTSAS